MPNSRIRHRPERGSAVAVRAAVLDFLASTEVKRLSPKTQEEYAYNLTCFADWCASYSMVQDRMTKAWKAVKMDSRYTIPVALHLVDDQAIHCFLEHVQATHKPWKRGKAQLSSHTLAQYAKDIKRFLNWCCLDEQYGHHVQAIVVQRIKKPKLEETVKGIFSPEEIEALFRACDQEVYEHLRVRDRAILSVLLDSGLRATELITLTIGNVSLDPRDAHVRVLGKGRKWGEVGLGEQARRAIQKYLRQFREPTIEHEIASQLRGLPTRAEQQTRRQLLHQSLLFVNRAGDPLTRGGLYQIIARLAEWADVPSAHPHRFRHTWAVLFWRRTHDIRTLSKLLRHSSIAVTENYLKSILQSEARHGAPSVLDEL